MSPLHNKMICIPSEDSDQPGHPPSLISVFAAQRAAKDPIILHADSKNSDQTLRMSRLISLGAQIILLVLSRCDSDDTSR